MMGLFGRKKTRMSVDIKDSTHETKLKAYFKEKPFKIADFKMMQTLGAGTFGKVNLASLNIDGKAHPFAIKTLSKAEVCRLKQVAHIKAEKHNLMEVHHTFIVKLFHTFQDKLNLYFVLEYVIGGDFFSYLRRKGRLDMHAARFYAAELVVALSYLHSKDIIYRDLKPENMLISAEGHVKLADFGFSKKLEKDKRTWTLCGTPEYLAPEIIHSIGHHYGVDWWALGILLFEMLAGFPPFYDEQPFNIYQKIVGGISKVTFPKGIDINAKKLIKALLKEDYRQRLGCLKGGGENVRKHKWFKGLGFKKVVSQELPPPFIPKFSDIFDTCNFENYVEDEDDIVDTMITKVEDAKFKDF